MPSAAPRTEAAMESNGVMVDGRWMTLDVYGNMSSAIEW
jgi:hypothetical protein